MFFESIFASLALSILLGCLLFLGFVKILLPSKEPIKKSSLPILLSVCTLTLFGTLAMTHVAGWPLELGIGLWLGILLGGWIDYMTSRKPTSST